MKHLQMFTKMVKTVREIERESDGKDPLGRDLMDAHMESAEKKEWMREKER